MNIFLFCNSEQIKNFFAAPLQLARWRGFSYGRSMLSVLIETRDHEELLARTLASLVGGAVEGVVREVIVCDRGSSDRTRDVAGQTGCLFLPDAGIGAGIEKARGEWLLLLEPGARLVDGWIEAVLAHVGDEAGPACFRQARQPFLKRLFGRRRPLARGLVIARGQALPLARAKNSAAAIARAVRARRLDAEIAAAPWSG